MSENNLPNQWPWSSELDAMVADPQHHQLLFENNKVRVLDVRIAAGDTTALHTHRWPASIYVISWSHFIRYDKNGNEVIDTRNNKNLSPPPPVLWSEPLPPHKLKNAGDNEIRMISVEIKNIK